MEATPPKRPIYKKWWFWTGVGAVAVLAVGLGAGLGKRGGDSTSNASDVVSAPTWNGGPIDVRGSALLLALHGSSR